MDDKLRPEARFLLWLFAVMGISMLGFTYLVVSNYGFGNKETLKRSTTAKIPPITYEHTSDYIGHVGDCEMYKVIINETNGRNEVKVNSFIMAKCPNATTSILE